MQREEVPFRDGMTTGAFAWAAGVMLAAAGLLLFGDRLSFAAAVLWYSSLHLWPLVTGTGSGAGLFVLSLVPFGVLVASGYAVAIESGTTGWRPVGLAVAAGYFPVAALSHVVVFVSGGLSSVVVAVVAMVTSGFLFPIAFAGLGGIVAERVGE